MTDDRRLTTDRFYGGTTRRIELLRKFLSFVESEIPQESETQEWLLSNTNAQSREAIDRHLQFLGTLELIDISDSRITIGHVGQRYLETSDEAVLYEALRSNVKGFGSILRRIRDGPMTDEDVMDLLVTQFEDFNMNSPGVAARHREWLQVLGYIERSDGVNRITEDGLDVVATYANNEQRFDDKKLVSLLRSHLLETDMSCVPAGRQSVSEGVYPSVEAAYPGLCNDDFLCSEAHDTGRDHPEWKHVVQEALHQLANNSDSRVRRVEQRGIWQFNPLSDGLGEQGSTTELPEGNPTPRRYSGSSTAVERDRQLVDNLKELYDDTCQVCGDRRLKRPDEGFSHAHHLKPLGRPHNGPDVPENVVVVCPNHHEDFENGTFTVDPESLEVRHFYDDQADGERITTRGEHEIAPRYVWYHNRVRVRDWD